MWLASRFSRNKHFDLYFKTLVTCQRTRIKVITELDETFGDASCPESIYSSAFRKCKSFGFLCSNTNSMAQKPKLSRFWCICPKISVVNCIYLAAPTWLIFSGLIELAKLQMKLYQEFQNFATRWCQLICLLFGFSLFIFFPETAELISLQIIKILCKTQLFLEKQFLN